MAQRTRTKAGKQRSREQTPRRLASRVSKGRKRASGRQRRVILKRPDYARHEVSLDMPNPERWRFKEELNSANELRFYFEWLPVRRASPVRVLYRGTTQAPYLSLKEYAMDVLGEHVFVEQPGIEGRFRGMPALIVDQNVSMRKFGYTTDVRVHERSIFFRNGDRWCHFSLLTPPNEFSQRLMDIDEVLKGILVN
jgi:hypothetical protein